MGEFEEGNGGVVGGRGPGEGWARAAEVVPGAAAGGSRT